MINSLATSDASAYRPIVRPSAETATNDRASSAKPTDNQDNKDAQPSVDPDAQAADTKPADATRPTSKTKSDKLQLSEADLAVVRELKQRDREVRQHEMAHMAASGGLAQGGPTYTYQRAPDGQNYAVGGEVNIDVSKGKNPEETIAKARTIRAAALAPATPSAPDRAIAARAMQMESQAEIQLVKLDQQDKARAANKLEKPEDAADPEQSPARELAQRIFSAITPQEEPALQLAA